MVYGSLHWALGRLAVGSEVQGKAYPYLAGEDPIRLLLPSLVREPPGRRMILVGASETGENMLLDRFRAAFPDHRIVPSGISTGTVDDVLVVLNYIEEVYGSAAVPEVIVVGVTVRMVGNFPRRFGPGRLVGAYSPLFNAINDYSPHRRVVPDRLRSRLEPKSRLEGERSRLRFLARKQQPRFRAALAAWLDEGLGAAGWERADVGELEFLDDVWNPLNWNDVPVLAAFTRDHGVVPTLRMWLSVYGSPYQTQYMRPLDPAWLAEDLAQQSFSRVVYEWDPGAEAEMVQAQLGDLREFAARHGARLYVVNMPENPISLQYYEAERYEAYLDLLRTTLSGVPFLDLHDRLPADAFVDETHAVLSGAEQVSEEIIRFITAEEDGEG